MFYNNVVWYNSESKGGTEEDAGQVGDDRQDSWKIVSVSCGGLAQQDLTLAAFAKPKEKWNKKRINRENQVMSIGYLILTFFLLFA